MPADISIDLLRQLLRLDPETGRLYWLRRPVEMFAVTTQSQAHNAAIWNGKFAGKEAFTSTDKRGARQGALFNQLYLAHRVAFALHFGRWPEGTVDHRDGDPGNNRPENLREATQQENCRNQRPKGGVSHYKGVSWDSRRSTWRTMARDRTGKHRHVGTFADEIAAAHAYDAFVHREHGDFARPNFGGNGA